MVYKERTGRGFEKSPLGERVFREVKAIGKTIRPDSVPESLVETIPIHWTAHKNPKNAVNRLFLTKEMFTLRSLTGRPSSTRLIYYYGPYLREMGAALKELQDQGTIRQASMRQDVSPSTPDIHNVDAHEGRHSFILVSRIKLAYFDDELLERHGDIIEILESIDPWRQLINVTTSLALDRQSMPTFPRAVCPGEELCDSVLNGVEALARRRVATVGRWRESIQQGDDLLEEMETGYTSTLRTKFFVKKRERLKFAQDMKDSITNKLLILNAIHIYNHSHGIVPRVDDVAHCLCSHLSLLDNTIRFLKRDFDKKRNFDTCRKLGNESLSIDDAIRAGLIAEDVLSNVGDYLDQKWSMSEAVDHLKREEFFAEAESIRKSSQLDDLEAERLREIESYQQRQRLILESGRVCVEAMADEGLLEIGRKKEVSTNVGEVWVGGERTYKTVAAERHFCDDKREKLSA